MRPRLLSPPRYKVTRRVYRIRPTHSSVTETLESTVNSDPQWPDWRRVPTRWTTVSEAGGWVTYQRTSPASVVAERVQGITLRELENQDGSRTMFFHLDQTSPPQPSPLTPVTSEELFRAVSELSLLGQLQSPSLIQHSTKSATTVKLPQLNKLQLDPFTNPLLAWWDKQAPGSGALPSRSPSAHQATTKVVSDDDNAWGTLGTFLSGPSLRESSRLPFLAPPSASLVQQEDNSRKEALSLLSCANINAWIMQFVSAIADSTEVATAR